MRLRNLFMILLLCMTVGMFGVSCTGDDGAQGPPGPKGDTGEPGEVTEADIPEDTDFYPFLESWGVKDGEVGCNDDVLKGMGPLPGDMDGVILEDIKAAERIDDQNTGDGDESNLNSPIIVTCGASGSVFAMGDGERLDAMIDVGGNPLNIVENSNVSGSTVAANGLDNRIVLYKTGRAEVESTEDVDPTNFNRAMKVKTTKRFVGGLVFAKLGDTAQNRHREALHYECGTGASPPDIRGTWRAVQVSTETREYANGVQVVPPDGDDDNDLPDDPMEVTTLVKVCLVLDAHPGVTKCFVSDKAKAMDSVATYDGTDLDTVVAMDKLPAANDQNQWLFDKADTDGDFEEVEQICTIMN